MPQWVWWIWSNADKLADITTFLTILFLIGVLIFTRRQVRAALGASAIRVFEQIYADLNSKESRNNRRFIYAHKLSPEEIYSNQLIHSKVENVCVSLDRVGVLLTNKFVPKGPAQDLYLDMYVDVFIRCWAKLESYVEFMRKKKRNPQHYINFERLAKLARKYWKRKFPGASIDELIGRGREKRIHHLPKGEKLLLTNSTQVICDKPQTWFRVRLDEVENIKTKEKSKYTVAEIGPSVGIVTLDENENITLVGQWRYTLDKYSWEIPTGVIEKGENEFEAAERELIEETGLKAAKFTKLGTIDNSNGSTIDVGHLFLATGLTQLKPRREPNEVIEMDTVSLWEAIELVYENEITESLSVAAILKAGHYLSRFGLK